MDLRKKRSRKIDHENNAKIVLLLATTAALLTSLMSFSGCVSVSLSGGGKPTKAEDVKYRDPGSPFTAINNSRADKAWQNKSNGNSISYISTCHDPADPPLESVQGEMLSVFEDAKVSKSENLQFNGREALQTEAQGLVDGVRMRTQLLIFKKNNCIYTLSYIGTATSFPENQTRFNEFINSFEAP